MGDKDKEGERQEDHQTFIFIVFFGHLQPGSVP